MSIINARRAHFIGEYDFSFKHSMKDIKTIVANNLSDLRQKNNMTQLELAEKLNYSDKTISKWERAESTPDVAILVQIAEFFGVTLDYLVSDANDKDRLADNDTREPQYNRKAISYVCESAGLIIAAIAFIITTLIIGKVTFQFLYFIYALPIVMVVKLVFNTLWFNPRNNYYIISLLMWALLAAIHITFWYFGVNVALVYLIGVAGEIVIILWSFIKKPQK